MLVLYSLICASCGLRGVGLRGSVWFLGLFTGWVVLDVGFHTCFCLVVLGFGFEFGWLSV